MLTFCDCTEHIGGKSMSFLMTLDLLNSNKTVVSLSPGFFKAEVLYISLCDLRTKALINLITNGSNKKGLGKKDSDSLLLIFCSSAEFNRGSSLSSFCLSVCVFLLWSIFFLLKFFKIVLFSFKCCNELVILNVLFFCMNIWWEEKHGSFWDTKWYPCTLAAVKYASTAVANSMFTRG